VLDEKAALKNLQAACRGTNVEVRFFPQCITCWRWQLGLNGDEHFELLAWGASPDKLADAIEARALATPNAQC